MLYMVWKLHGLSKKIGNITSILFNAYKAVHKIVSINQPINQSIKYEKKSVSLLHCSSL